MKNTVDEHEDCRVSPPATLRDDETQGRILRADLQSLLQLRLPQDRHRAPGMGRRIFNRRVNGVWVRHPELEGK